MKNLKNCGHHTSKNIKNQIVNNIRKQLNIQEKLILLISRKYTLKIFKLGFQSCFNWEHATYYTINNKKCETTHK